MNSWVGVAEMEIRTWINTPRSRRWAHTAKLIDRYLRPYLEHRPDYCDLEWFLNCTRSDILEATEWGENLPYVTDEERHSVQLWLQDLMRGYREAGAAFAIEFRIVSKLRELIFDLTDSGESIEGYIPLKLQGYSSPPGVDDRGSRPDKPPLKDSIRTWLERTGDLRRRFLERKDAYESRITSLRDELQTFLAEMKAQIASYDTYCHLYLMWSREWNALNAKGTNQKAELIRRDPRLAMAEHWKSLDGAQFEVEIGRLLSQCGQFSGVSRTGGKGDRGVDLIVIDVDGQETIFQCKAHKSAASPGVVRDLYGALSAHPRAKKAVLVVPSGFTVGAARFAKEVGIELWDADKIISLAPLADETASLKSELQRTIDELEDLEKDVPTLESPLRSWRPSGDQVRMLEARLANLITICDAARRGK